MSTKIYTAQKSRPYKVEVFGLQDDFIGTLQSFADLSIGRVQDPKVTLSGDGTQEFTCSIPRFYINPKTNEKIINPRWEDIKNGVLAENTRVLKVFVIEEGEIKVYPFIVDKIIDKRDSHFSVYKEVTASGLAFAELGKTGLRLELNKDVVEADYKKDNSTVATLDYWLDKVFPRDESGHWLTPWSYEIRMDWSNYSDAAQRETNKMYDDIQVTKWDVVDGKLIPTETSVLQEKARYVNSDKGSNKYNITQTIAETFGIFCVYEYKCEANGQFVKTYYDEEKKCYMTGRTAVFYNRAIKTDNPFTLDYQKNLQSISRTCDSTEVYTKLFVDPIQSDTMTDGYVTIANTEANPLMDEFILNFDYLYSKGSITEYQKNFIDEYSIETHKINEALRSYGERINLLTVEINDKKAEKAGAEKSISAIQEELTHYQTLRDNDVTNTPVVKDKNNSYSVVFVKDKEKAYYTASIRLEGVLSGSINGYDTYEYENIIFTSDNLVSSQDYKPVLETDLNMYVVLDEDGYATGLYTSNTKWFETDNTENSYSLNAGYIIYLALQYSPHNKYVEVCNRFERMIVKKEETITICDSIIKNKQTELDTLVARQTELLAEKDSLNQKLERIMGPALREGHWSAKDYEDIGRKSETTVKAGNAAVDNVSFVFDTELFDGEEKGYYYASAEDASSDIRTYYDYIDVSSYIADWKDKNPEDLVIHLTYPEFNYTVTKSQYEGLAAGDYFILYNMTKYYFTLPQTLITGNMLRLCHSPKTGLLLQVSVDEGFSWNIINFEEKDEKKHYANLSDAFEGLNKYLGTYKIYPNAGFVYAFALRDDGTIKPILLFNNPEINYSIYKRIGYSFDTEKIIETELHNNRIYNSKFTICHPRIVIAKNNVNYDDDLLTITEEGAEKALTKFEDYSVLLRNGQPRFNLKITKNTTPYALLNKNYTIVYRVSQANEMLYRDALEVARENSRPRFSYEVSVAQLPNTVESYELGQLGYINDSALGVKAAKGYINQITLVLDSPKDDEIQIQNYKTKFEDLFATITASSEAMKSNQQSYDVAASIINPSTGGIQGSILQDSFNNNKVELTYSNTQVHIDDTDGITLTNTEPYSNGVYGQVVMRGGGIYLSNQVDNNYERIWSTGITPNGINASMITTGQLDANLIRIFAGNNVAFQWNSEGIYAYKRDENNQFLPNTYVRYSDKGLQYIDNGDTIVDLGWNGLAINSQDGSVSLTGEDGLIVYDGLKNAEGTNHVVSLGRFGEEGNYSYGLKLYKKDETGAYVETLTSDNNGQLWLKDYLAVGADKPYNVSFQWEESLDKIIWEEIQSETARTSTLEVAAINGNNNHYYRCKINHSKYGIFYSEPAMLEIVENSGFYISKHPSNQTVLENSYVTYSVEAIGTNLTYQWQWKKRTAPESAWANSGLNGNKTATIKAQALDYRGDYEYRVIITNDVGEQLISESAALYIVNKYTGAIIKEQPKSVGIIENADSFATFTISNFEEIVGASGISGLEENGSRSVRFWAGDSFVNRSVAPFRVLHDGSVYASKLVIGGSTGDITASELIDQVGGLQDSVDNLGTQAAQLSIRTTSTAGQIYNSSEENPVTTLFTEIYLGEIRLTGNQLDEQGYESRKLTYYRKRLSDTEWMSYSTPTEDINGAYQATNVKMEVGVQYKAELTYLYHGLSYEATSAPIAFTMVSNGNGLSGQDGVGISEVIEYYYTNNIEVTPAPKEEGFNELGVQYEEDGIAVKAISKDVWASVLSNPDASNKFLWNVEETHYSNGDNISYITYTQPALIARYTENGAEGEPGRGIESITEYYMATSESSGVVAGTNVSDGSWTTEAQSVSSTKKYLWNYEIITYDAADANGSYKWTSEACIIGVYGDKGNAGDNGRGIKEIKEEYAISDSSSIVPTSDWDSTLKNPTSEKPYLWVKETILYNQAPLKEEFTRIIATYAPKGDDGKGISNIENYYQISSSNLIPEFDKMNPISKGWENGILNTDTVNIYLWNVELITWTDGSKTNTSPRIISTHGATGNNAINYRLSASVPSITKKIAGEVLPDRLTLKIKEISNITKEVTDISPYTLIVSGRTKDGDIYPYGAIRYDIKFNLVAEDGTKTLIQEKDILSIILNQDEKIKQLDGNTWAIMSGDEKPSHNANGDFKTITSLGTLAPGQSLWVRLRATLSDETKRADGDAMVYKNTTENTYSIEYVSRDIYRYQYYGEDIPVPTGSTTPEVINNLTPLFTVTKNENHWLINNYKDCANKAELFTFKLLGTNKEELDNIGVLIELSDELKELATIDENKVYIAEGKVRANSIVANAITADKIAANAVTADKIKANSITVGKVTSDFGKNLDISSNTGIGLYVNKNGIDTTSVTLNSTGIALKTGGTFTVESGNFSIDSSGNVELDGKITAESGSIGGWNIGETSLHSGLDTSYVALSSDTDSNYRIWAGDTVAEDAPFSVEKDGTVTLTKIRALGEPDSNGEQSEKIISLYNQPLWAIWGNYYNRVTGFTAKQAADGTVTLTITRQSAEALTVNFKKAVVDSSNYYIQFNGGGGTNFSASLMRSGSTSSSTGISAYANLKLNLNKAQSTVTVAPTGGSAIASISVKDVYNSVTVDSIDVDGTVTFTSGNYAQIPVTAIASNTLKMMTTLSVDCAKVYNKGISDAKSKITLSFNPEQDITLDYGKSVDVKATVLYDNTSMGVSDYIKVTAPEAPAKPTNFSVTGSIGSNIYTYNMTADYVYRNNEESSSAGTFIAKEAYDNGVAAGKTRYEPTTISATSSYSGNNEYAVAITAKNSAGATVGTGSHTVDARDAYDDGCDAEAKSLALSQTANKTLAYGESITIKATTTNNTTGKSVKITAPANNFANGAASVTLTKGTWTNGSHTVTASNGETVTISIPNVTLSKPAWASNKTTIYAYHGSAGPLGSVTVDAQSIYDAGYEAGKAAMGLSRNGNTISVTESSTKSMSYTYKASSHSYTPSSYTASSHSYTASSYTASSHNKTSQYNCTYSPSSYTKEVHSYTASSYTKEVHSYSASSLVWN